MGKIIRRAVAALLCITAIIIAVIPAGNVEATSVHGEYEYDGTTLVKYLGSDSTVTIPNWITKVGKDAFADNLNLRKINLPDSVTSIDYQAFKGCKYLQEAVIPESVKSIGASAFSGCSSLYAVSIPEKCDSIGSGAFAGCSSLSTIPVDPSNENYICIDGVLYSRDGSKLVQYLAGRPFTTYSMPSNNNSIEEYAFWGSSNVSRLNISPNVDSIPEYAFAYCSGLRNVTIPQSVERINAYAFADCNNLESINIPESVGYIDDRAFYMTDGTVINFVDADGNVVRSVNSSDVESYGDGESGDLEAPAEDLQMSEENTASNIAVATAISSQNAADNEKAAENVTNTSESIPNETEDTNVSASNEFIQPANSDNELGRTVIVGGNAVVLMPSDVKVKGFNLEEAESEDDYAQTSVIPVEDAPAVLDENTDTIGVRAFYKNMELTSIDLPENLITIGEFAFARSALLSVNIPEGTTNIDYAAFFRCPNLAEVNIPSSVSCIALGAFDDTPYINNFLNGEGDDFLIVGDDILLAYRGSGGDITIPEGVKHIAAGAFKDNERITGVDIPSSVTDIGEDAFCGCRKLSKLTMAEGIKNINDRAFKGTALPCVYFPDSVETLGLGSFDTTENGSPLKSVIFKGRNVPNVTYNNTATRLSARDLRTKALEGVGNVIVSGNCDLSGGTLFDPRFLGFSGQVYSMEDAAPEATDEQNEESESTNAYNTLLLERALSVPDDSGNVIIDPHVDIAGTPYIMGNVKDNAFDAYKNWNIYFDNKPKSVIIDGNRSEELDKLLESFSDNESDKKSDASEDTTINDNSDNTEMVDSGNVTQLQNIKCTLASGAFDMGSSAVAVIPDSKEILNLTISDNYENPDKMTEALKRKYGNIPDNGIVHLSFDLTDRTGTIPIHKLGENKMEVSLPIPNELMGQGGLTVATLDDNGLLEELSTETAEDESGVKKLRFVAGHCSAYCIYSKDAILSALSGENVYTEEALGNTGNFDGVLYTLNKKSGMGISVKWYVVVILLAFAGILVLYKDKKRG